MRPTLSANRLLILLTLVGAVAGCGIVHESCNQPQRYETAKSVPPLKVPEGLTPPNTKNSLVIPEVAAERKKLTSKDACRDAPPAFYADRPNPST